MEGDPDSIHLWAERLPELKVTCLAIEGGHRSQQKYVIFAVELPCIILYLSDMWIFQIS